MKPLILFGDRISHPSRACLMLMKSNPGLKKSGRKKHVAKHQLIIYNVWWIVSIQIVMLLYKWSSICYSSKWCDERKIFVAH